MKTQRTAQYWENKESKDSKDNDAVKCLLCPNCCIIKKGRSGICTVRENVNGELIASAYGLLTSVALDPIEKKPLYEFHSGKMILSLGSYGCNFHCPFCQNYAISKEYKKSDVNSAVPDEIVQLARYYVPAGNIGVAYTYNEPIINYEYVKDCCRMIKEAGMVNVLVTNGYINRQPLKELLPFVDAMNIDIKGGAGRTYKMVGGTQEDVKRTVELSYESCHIEVTTLVIPGENEDDIEDIAAWLASVDKKIPYHLSRFFPGYKYDNRESTPAETMHRLKEIAGRYLENVYLGNI